MCDDLESRVSLATVVDLSLVMCHAGAIAECLAFWRPAVQMENFLQKVK